jgi:hypothetical protein
MVAPVVSSPFSLGGLVASVQFLTYFLMTMSTIQDATNYQNQLGLPPNINAEVRAIQFIAIISCRCYAR